MIDLTGKVALVTGAARGQGAGEARLFAELGARVVIGDVLDDEGASLAAELGDAARFVHLDVTERRDWNDAVRAADDAFGGLDVLVNNAGVALNRWLSEFDEDEYRRVIDVNQVGVALGMHCVIEPMRARGGGSIVNISSTGGNRGVAGSIAYAASKWAVRGMTKTAAVELGRHGIRVNSVHPGVIDTAMVGFDHYPAAAQQAIVGHLPIARIGTVDEVAATVAFLASDASSYSTGGEYMVDGGSLAGRSLFADVVDE